LVSNSGGHKCITNITGIGFVYSGYDKPYTKDLPEDAIPIAFYEGSNNFIKDIKQKLLRFRKLSEKQIQAAIKGMEKEGIDVEALANPKQGRGTTELTKDIKEKFVELLNDYIKNPKPEPVNESVQKKRTVSSALKEHMNGKKLLTEKEWDIIMKKLQAVEDNMGQWKHPEKCTMINSSNITMENVNYPLLGIDETGHYKIMQPEKTYRFPGNKVFEIPLKGKYKKLGLTLLGKA